MKKNYSFFTSAITALVLMFASSSAFAGETSNYWYYNHVTTYPTGGGKVYMSPNEVEDTKSIEYQNAMDVKYLAKDAYLGEKGFYVYAQPEEGFIFVGWKAVKAEYWNDIIDDPTINIVDYMEESYLSNDAEAYFNLATSVSTESTEVEAYSIDPDNTIVGIFGHVAIKAINGQDGLGTFGIEDPTVDIGDFTTIYASPVDSSTTTFLYWIDDEGNKYTDNPLEIEVSRNITYYPVFENPEYQLFDFGEGEYKILSFDKMDCYFPNDVYYTVLTPYATQPTWAPDHYDTTYVTKPVEVDTTLIIEGVEVDTFLVIEKEFEEVTPVYGVTTKYESSFPGLNYVSDINTYGYYSDANNAFIIYGEGLMALRIRPMDSSSAIREENYLVETSKGEVDIATLPQNGTTYYVIDPKTGNFNAVTEGIIPQGSGYLALPASEPASHFQTLNYITEAEAADIKAMSTSFNREINGGYAADDVEFDVKKACELLGVESLAGVTMKQVNVSTLEFTKDYANDGWLTKDGDYTTWGNGSYVCLKTPSADGKMALCTMPGNEPALGSSWLGIWALCTDSATVYLETVVNFVAPGGLDYEIVKTITVNKVVLPATAYEGATAEFDPADVCAALGIDDITKASQYIMNVTDGELVKNTTDGWRSKDGDALGWGNAGGVCVKIQNPASGSIDYIGAYDESWTEGSTFTAKWAFLCNAKCVVIDVVLTFSNDPTTAIEKIDSDAKNATIFNLAGQKLAAPAKGINIINGKKFMVK